ncbi:HAD-IA family hydrolase [Aurantimonas endophytica]|uniref:Phosphoglycolate phosphatase n=1 Tax=Aurantimonas endophytica TaxID=1522175 RepID=A0A7W6HA42_9HYPH|nr:HAD-IA family hydrolase [Aurantimonas endophytica]MBB4001434.1 phosphoglycolate phosphatase [Aurantimonas endophytica]MCO6402924.1 HAD-IA family hydrolase [Aurantimonas endophytica]
MKAILFDCDGTIADSCGVICDIMRRTFVAHGLDAPADAATRDIIGLSLDVAIARLHPGVEASLLASLVTGYRTQFRAARVEPGFREMLFPEMRGLIDRLSARDSLLLGMVTGKSRRGVAALCAEHDMAAAFSVVRTADDCPSKPHPAMVLECCEALGVGAQDTLVVGDSIYDVEMARAAGATAIGVAWGTHRPDMLFSAGAAEVAGTPGELGLLIDQWREGGLATARREVLSAVS